MKQKYTIELVEEHDAVNFYSIHLDEEELSELERFFEKFPVGCEYDDEIDIIIAWLDKIGENGALALFPSGRKIWRWSRSNSDRRWKQTSLVLFKDFG